MVADVTLLACIQFGLVISLSSLPLWWVAGKATLWSRSMARDIAVPGLEVRLFESTVLTFCLVSVATCSAMRAWNSFPCPTAIPRFQNELAWAVTGMGLLSLLVWSLASWRFLKTACFLGGIGIFTLLFSIGAFPQVSPDRYAADIRRVPLPIDIVVEDDLAGIDVWFNEVYLGKTPVHTDYGELIPKIPRLKQPPKDWADSNSIYWGKLNNYRPLHWIHLDPASRVSINDENSRLLEIHARTKLGGVTAYQGASPQVTMGHRIFGQLQSGRIELSVLFPDWDEEIALLLQRARMSGYQVDSAWLTSFNSYGMLGWRFLNQAAASEAELLAVVNQVAAQNYQVNEVQNAEAAWTLLTRICNEADQKKDYQTNGPAGMALDQILDKLEVERLVSMAEDRLRELTPDLNWGGSRRTEVHGKKHFGIDQWNDRSDLRPSDFVMAHAIYRLDEMLDARDDSTDNLIETRLVPRIMKLGHRGGMLLEIADLLGGTAIETLRSRSSTVQVRDASPSRFIGGVEVDAALFESAQLRSDAGRRFRRARKGELLQMVSRCLTTEFGTMSSNLPNWMDFLFLPVDSQEMLAVKYWPEFNRLMRTHFGGEGEVARRWEYLSRLFPSPKPEVYAQVLRDFYQKANFFNQTVTPLKSIPPKDRTAVVHAIWKAAKSTFQEFSVNSEQHSNYLNLSTELLQVLFETPDGEATRLALALTKSADNRFLRLRGPDAARRVAQQGLLSEPALAILVEAPEPEYRELTLKLIQTRPTPAHRSLLTQLLEDPDETIKQRARDCAAELKALEIKAYPRRKLPVQK